MQRREKSREKNKVLILEERERVDGCVIGGVGGGVDGEGLDGWLPEQKGRERVRNLEKEMKGGERK